MKTKSKVKCAVAIMVLIPIAFCALLAFSGVFDALNREIALKNSLSAFYEAMEKEDLASFKIDKRVKKLYDLQLLVFDQEKTIIYSDFPDVPLGTKFSSALVEYFDAQNFDDTSISIWNLETLEKSNARVLKNLPGYGKYRFKALSFSHQKTPYQTQPAFRVVITLILVALILVSVIIVVGFVISFSHFLSIDKRIFAHLAKGDYSRDIPENSDTKETPVIAIINDLLRRIRMDEKQKTHIIMGLSHDFKTPLTLIKGYTEMIEVQNKDKNPTITKSTQVINGKVEQLENMVTELTEFASLEEGDYPIKKEEMNFTDWLLAYIHQSESDATLAGKKMISDIQLPFDFKLKIDTKLLERAMDNLVHNALRYTGDDGEVKIFARLKDEKYLEFGVEDNGSGIDKEDKPFVFDMFYRASPSRNTPGMGIGLSVVKDIVQAHGWTISVKDAKPKGSVFVIEAGMPGA